MKINKMRDQILRFVMILIFIFTTQASYAATITWDGGGDGVSWTDPLNWDPDGLPVAGDDVIISNGDAVTLSSIFSPQIDDLMISNGSTLMISSGGSLTTVDQGDISVTGASTLDITGTGTLTSGGFIKVLVGSSMTVSGTVSSDSDSDITVDGSSSSIQITGTLNAGRDVIASAGGTLDFDGTMNIGDDLIVTGLGSILDVSGVLDVTATIQILDQATAVFQSGSTTTLSSNLIVTDATLTIEGSIINDGPGANDDLKVNGTANITINSPAIVEFEDIVFSDGGGDGGSTLTMNGGTLTLNDNIDFSNTTDNDQLIVNGGTILITAAVINLAGSSGTIVSNGGSIEALDFNGTVGNELIKNGGGIVENGVQLPVTLVSFVGHLSDFQIVLDWVTSSEQNNAFFEIQKSLDGVSFQTIGRVNGYGTTNEKKNYQYNDNSIGNLTVAYYRLLQFDFDGKFEIFNTISVNISFSDNIILLSPNPVINTLTIEFSTHELEVSRKLKIIDLQGNLMLEKVLYTDHLLYEITNLSDKLKSGIYMVQIDSNNKIFREKILIK